MANVYLDSPIRGYETVAEGEYVLLKVSDNGTGIESEHLNRIFEPFFTRKKLGRSGTGLGMSIVWGTVKDHLGYIEVVSSVGRGSAFSVYLPVNRDIIEIEE